ncbi:MAG: alpha/beta hydrolase [Bacteroidaceae bacterium]|nr:alpha/beta hydrolase [Bacteroidaceae bacterium]
MAKKLLKIFLWIIGLIVSAIIIFVCYFWFKFNQAEQSAGRKVEWESKDGEILRNLKYGEGTRNVYDLFLPPTKDSNALMLFVHGGAWMSGNKEDIEWAARRYTKEGYVSATINYSRAGKDTLALGGEYSAPSIESMVTEIGMSIDAIIQECKRQGITLTQMAIGGYSAGGHLAMLYATRHAEDSPLPIRFQISWVGPADFTRLFPTNAEYMSKVWEEDSEENIRKRKEHQQTMYFLGGKSLQTDSYNAALEDSLKRIASPLFQIKENTPPAVLVYGAKDRLVSAEHGKATNQALEQIGIESRLYVFPNSGHELGADPEYADSVQHTILDFCQRYFGSDKQQ